ncbi:MAG TPA: DEAD/DEAH box helicase [Bacteroidales bacterium]|nr:DEAD/DEAH box helicase [Bacteroidales bacterium]
MKFSELNLHPSLMEGLDAMGFENATPIQTQAIPVVLNQKDLIACAQTGTGKTAAFILPVVHSLLLLEDIPPKPQVLILVPTRELAIQIDQQIEGLAYFTGVSSVAVYGGGSGTDYANEKKALQSGAPIVVATPGRLIAHLNMGYVDFSMLRFLVLDEADRMLDMGFLPDMQRIIAITNNDRQTLMFSATMPDAIRKLARQILKSFEEINLAVSKPAENVLQAAYMTFENQKIPLIQHLIEGRELPLVLIFSATKKSVKEIEQHLLKKKLNAKAIHSDLTQEERGKVLRDFKHREIQILVATDIVSRGIDIDDISLIINYNVPGDAEDYVHRVGRTARAEKTGVALTFINEEEIYKFNRIEEFIASEIRKLPLPAVLGEGPEYVVKRRNQGFKRKKYHRGNKPGNKR